MLLGGMLLLDHLEAAVGIFRRERQRPEGRQRLGQHHRARSRPAAAVRGREGLVQVDVHRVDAEVAGADLADDGVEIGAVAIDEGAGGMDRVADRLHLGLEQPAGVGVGDHHRGDVGSQAGP
jgi:hypothetical protein